MSAAQQVAQALTNNLGPRAAREMAAYVNLALESRTITDSDVDVLTALYAALLKHWEKSL